MNINEFGHNVDQYLSNPNLGVGIGNFWNNISGVSAANQFTAEQNAINRMYNSAEAVKAYNRELYADSTKYQRTMADLKRAGVNPLMAVAGASAGSVSAAPASASSGSSVGSSGGVIISAILRGISQIVSSASKGEASKTAALIRAMK